MKLSDRVLYIAWAALYLFCVIFSAIAAPTGGWLVPELVISLLFFVPPAVLLYRGIRESRRFPLLLIRNLSIGVLALTTVVICLTFLSVGMGGGTDEGLLLQVLLIIVSAPMLCSPVWGISLFLWACLLMVCIKYRKLLAPVKNTPAQKPRSKKKKR